MTDNLTVCPDCGSEFDTVAQTEDENGAYQGLHQECPNCGHDVTIAIVNYPDHTFEVIGPAVESDGGCDVTVPRPDTRIGTEQCGSDSAHRIDRLGEPVEAVCVDHLGAHQINALDMADGL